MHCTELSVYKQLVLLARFLVVSSCCCECVDVTLVVSSLFLLIVCCVCCQLLGCVALVDISCGLCILLVVSCCYLVALAALTCCIIRLLLSVYRGCCYQYIVVSCCSCVVSCCFCQCFELVVSNQLLLVLVFSSQLQLMGWLVVSVLRQSLVASCQCVMLVLAVAVNE